MSIQRRQYEHSDPMEVLMREESLSRRRREGCCACKFHESLELGLTICTRGVFLRQGQHYCELWLEVE